MTGDFGMEAGPDDLWHRTNAYKGIWLVARAGRYEIHTSGPSFGDGNFDVWGRVGDTYAAQLTTLNEARRIVARLTTADLAGRADDNTGRSDATDAYADRRTGRPVEPPATGTDATRRR
jgi:hypothetical protein